VEGEASLSGQVRRESGRPRSPREHRAPPRERVGSEKEHGFLGGSKSLKREIEAGAGFYFKRKSGRLHRKV
jgi:hypothetical protein